MDFAYGSLSVLKEVFFQMMSKFSFRCSRIFFTGCLEKFEDASAILVVSENSLKFV